MKHLTEKTFWFLGGLDLGFGAVAHAPPYVALIGGILIIAGLALTVKRIEHAKRQRIH